MKTTLRIGLISFLFLLTISCNLNPYRNLSRIDLTEATALFIADAETGSRSSSSITGRDVIYKLLEDGTVEIASLLDANENEIISDFPPELIEQVNEEYIFIGFGSSAAWQFLVRVSDGAVFQMGEWQGTNDGSVIYNFENELPFKNATYIQSDEKDSMYFLSNRYDTDISYNAIMKVDATNPDSLTSSVITTDLENVKYFCVNHDGDIVYSFYDTLYSSVGGMREKSASGSLINISPGGSTIYIDGNGEFAYNNSSNLNTYVFNFGNNFVFVESDPSTRHKAVQTDNYYFTLLLESNNESHLQRIDPSTSIATTILRTADYDIYDMTVLSDEKVLFNALRMIDGVKVIGQVDLSGTIEILDETINDTVTSLIRIK